MVRVAFSRDLNHNTPFTHVTNASLLLQDVLPRNVAQYQRDEALRTHTTTVAAIVPIATLSESDSALFKSTAEDNRILVTVESVS